MNNTKICIVGLGYVGLPLAVTFAEKYQVIAFDINPNRIDELKHGKDRTLEVGTDLLSSVENNIQYTSDIYNAKDCNIYIVAVAHRQYKKYTSDDFQKLSKGEKVIMDIKNIVSNPTWRL